MTAARFAELGAARRAFDDDNDHGILDLIADGFTWVVFRLCRVRES